MITAVPSAIRLDLDEIAAKVLDKTELRRWERASRTPEGKATRRWCRNASDVIAVANGCWFVEPEGSFVVWWIERFCRLYEGEWAGQPFWLRGRHDEEPPRKRWLEWDDEHVSRPVRRAFARRAALHCEAVLGGDYIDWQYEITMRLFGWMRYSPRWHRNIRRFTEASIWVPKKNKKSPTLAAWGLYLTCGDGEAGQKVFFAAKDGQQARQICGEHAAQMMLQADPILRSECTLNRSLLQITHIPSKSLAKPLSSGGKSAKESKEGLNGCLLVDEVHVVDAEFMEIVGRTGISRAEPLKLEASTTGNNPESYGKGRYDYGKLVEAGTARDQGLLFAVWEIPQTLSLDDFEQDPVGWGRYANPAWGHTIHEEEYLTDFGRSKRTIPKFHAFLMYRCNKWLRSASPWLRYSDWEACATDRDLESFEGCPCVLAADKSKTQDMTALVGTFWEAGGFHDWQYDPEADAFVCSFCGEQTKNELEQVECPDGFTFYQYPLLWLPQATADKLVEDVSYLTWAAQGFVRLIPGEVIQDGYLKRGIREFDERFRIWAIYYDKTYCEDLTQWATEELGIERVQMPQTAPALSEPIVQWERGIITRNIRHGVNPCMDWQAGHVNLIEYANGKLMLAKPKRGDIRKIDGIVASVMSYAGAREQLKDSSGAWSGKPGTGMWG